MKVKKSGPDRSFQGVDVYTAVKIYGGFVKYYHSTETLLQMCKLVSRRSCRNILACCGGGDQSLALLSVLREDGRLIAFDSNPAQLFVLAAKAIFLERQKKPPYSPSFEVLEEQYPETVYSLPKDIRPIKRLYDVRSRKECLVPQDYRKKFAFVCDSGMFEGERTTPFWVDDDKFSAKIRARIPNIRLLHTDFYYLDQCFRKSMFDLIYISDISLIGEPLFYINRIKKVLEILRPGGRVLGHVDSGEQFFHQGVGLVDLVRRHCAELKLRKAGAEGSFIVFEKLR